jgi:transposase
VRDVVAHLAQVIRIDAVWLAIDPLDMRAGTDTALARVVQVFGAASPHHAYLFANRRATRMKVLIHDGVGIWRKHPAMAPWGVPTSDQAVIDAQR